MRSIAAILIVGSTLFFLASIGLTAKAIADLASPPLTSTKSSNGEGSTTSNSLAGSTSTSSYTSFTPTGSSSIFSAIETAINSNSDLITPSSLVSSTSAGASAITKISPTPTSFVSLPQQVKDENDGSNTSTNPVEESEQQGSEEYERPQQMNSNIEDNVGVPIQNLNANDLKINTVKEYQPKLTALNFPVLHIMPVPVISTQSNLQKRLMLDSDVNDEDTSKHRSNILLILFSVQEAFLFALLVGSLAYLWRYNSVDFDAEYKTILSRQAETRQMYKSDDAIKAAEKRTMHIKSYMIFFCILCFALLAVFVSSFVLLGIWFTVKDDITIITIALDALTFFFLLMICFAMIYDLRRSKKEEQYATSEGIHGVVLMEDENQQMKNIERAPSVVSSIKSLSSFATPPAGMNTAQYVGQPLRRLSSLQDTSNYQSHQTNLISPPIGTPPPHPGIDMDASYPSHMLASLPSPSSAGQQQQHFHRSNEGGYDDDENDEDREEWIGSMTETGNSATQQIPQRQRRPSPPSKNPLPSLPHSPVPESPSSVYSDVLLSPGTLCVAVPNIHGGTTMMPVSVGQSHQTQL
ncbi:hypothetical protein L7F22_039383 [Adiantum nelumboides]|nr:hypothetical protein [Adiantum nelumboides]